MKIKLASVRIAFPKLFVPEQVNGEGKTKYGACFAIVPGSPNAKALAAGIREVAKAKWGDKAPGIFKVLTEQERLCYQEKDKTNTDGEVFDGFEGLHFLNTSSDARPLVIDRDKTPLTERDGRPYAGCYVMASIELWAQDNKHGKRINATLRGVQFDKDGDAFTGGRLATTDEFDDLGEGVDADSFETADDLM